MVRTVYILLHPVCIQHIPPPNNTWRVRVSHRRKTTSHYVLLSLCILYTCSSYSFPVPSQAFHSCSALCGTFHELLENFHTCSFNFDNIFSWNFARWDYLHRFLWLFVRVFCLNVMLTSLMRSFNENLIKVLSYLFAIYLTPTILYLGIYFIFTSKYNQLERSNTIQ